MTHNVQNQHFRSAHQSQKSCHSAALSLCDRWNSFTCMVSGPSLPPASEHVRPKDGARHTVDNGETVALQIMPTDDV
eukprot:4634752-Amphidinium_carterae.1